LGLSAYFAIVISMNYWLIFLLFTCDILSNLFLKQQVIFILLALLVSVAFKQSKNSTFFLLNIYLFLETFLINSNFGITGFLILFTLISAFLARKYLQDRMVIIYALFLVVLCLQLWYNGEFQQAYWLTMQKIIANIIILNRSLKWFVST